MVDKMTGPKLFEQAVGEQEAVFNDQGQTDMERIINLLSAQVTATNAQTAAIVMLVNAMPDQLYELEAWRDVIPRPPLKECKGKETRRPECAKRHTEDCPFAEPPPESKHKLLPIGTRVLVTDVKRDDVTGELRFMNPIAGRISGYDQFKTKYRWQREWDAGQYYTYEAWAFADNRVEVHPDGPECPPPPQLVKQEPTGPRLYVQHRHTGKQGYIRNVRGDESGLRYDVQYFVPGAGPVWKRADSLEIIAESQVERCPNGQTGDECGSGENRCELCLSDEDNEAEAIEGSTGL